MTSKPMRFKRNGLWEFVAFFWLVVNCAMITVILVSYREMVGISAKTSLQQALLYVILVTNYIHTIVAYIENYAKRDRAIRMLNLLCELNEQIEKELALRMDYVALEKFYRNAVLTWLVEIVVLIMLHWIRFEQDGINEITNFSVFFMPTYVFSALSYFYTTTAVALIRFMMTIMSDYLESITAKDSSHFLHGSERAITWEDLTKQKPGLSIEKLFFLKRSFNRLWEISIAASSLMYLAMPIGCINEFLILVFNGYWLFLYLLNDMMVHWLFYVFVGTWSIAALTNLLFVANACTHAVEKVNHHFHMGFSDTSQHMCD